ncbi:uncharacterized protein K441DRAFT_665119 [Cenococcum geophilum 1.58]|uniref:uncharacterized protein n=1 Tax=Cenococcum geophilum 1.58 TaxID=794803 RepID=UPI00358EAB07|nr:hypothetical protein K441DRAFT_665119 [Cenococcum geophilum 1.58]
MRYPAAPTVSTVLATILLIVIIYVALFYPKKHHEGSDGNNYITIISPMIPIII